VALCALVLLAVGAAGCGEEEGVSEGAVVTAYVEAPLCDGASRPGGEVEVRLVCLPSPSRGARIDLATVGANARRATRDSTTVAYLQPDDPSITRFTRPILEAAGIGLISAPSHDDAVRRLTNALSESDPDSLRADVRVALGQS
jgi:hypothetical protein